MIYDLPTSVEVFGIDYEIRSDYRAILDICIMMSDPDLDNDDIAEGILDIFYPGFDDMPYEHYEEAIKQCFWFINCGEEEQNRSAPKLMDWEQDFKYVVAPMNRVAGEEIRSIEYLHWWTFVSYYYEIGDCFFAQIVRIRDKKAHGKQLDKSEREFYRKNRDAIDLKTKLSEEEEELFREWGV